MIASRGNNDKNGDVRKFGGNCVNRFVKVASFMSGSDRIFIVALNGEIKIRLKLKTVYRTKLRCEQTIAALRGFVAAQVQQRVGPPYCRCRFRDYNSVQRLLRKCHQASRSYQLSYVIIPTKVYPGNVCM